MDKDKIKNLIKRFNRGLLDEKELKDLEHLIEIGSVDLEELVSLQDLNDRLNAIKVPEPGVGMDKGFYSILKREKSNQSGTFWQKLIPKWNFQKGSVPVFQVAYTFLLILIGTGIGALISMNSNREGIDQLTRELSEMQNMMTLTLLEKSSASDRLKAIHLTSNVKEADAKVIEALLETLNHDDNANVRLAAIEALIKYAANERVRIGMIASITRQDLPIVQVALADAMVLIQEKRSIQNLKELEAKDETDQAVKSRLRENINKLI